MSIVSSTRTGYESELRCSVHDFNVVQKEVNGAVGRNVLITYSDPSEYRFMTEGNSVVSYHLE